MTVDLDRAHRVALGDWHRGSGKTFYHCLIVAGVLELGHRIVVVVLPEVSWVRHVLPMLQEVLIPMGFTLTFGKSPNVFAVESADYGKQYLRFASVATNTREIFVGQDIERTAFVDLTTEIPSELFSLPRCDR